MKNKLLLTLAFVLLISSPAVADVNATGAAAALSEISIGPSTTVIPREVLQALPATPFPYPLLNGKIGMFTTRHTPWMNQCKDNDTLIDVVVVNDGGLFTAIRFREVNKELLSTIRKYRDDKRSLCYWVGYNESSSGGGIGGGATGAMSSGNAFQSVGAAIVPGYNAATFNPKFFIEVDEVIPGPVEVAHITPPAPAPVAAQVPTPPPVTIINNIPAVPVPVPQPEAKKVVKKWRQDKGHCVKWEK